MRCSMVTRTALVALCVVGGNFVMAQAPDAPEQTKHLVLDARVIDSTINATLTVGAVKKDPRNPLFREDKPWEPRYDNLYANVLFDEAEGVYRCWYSPFIIDERTTSTPPEKRPATRYLGARPRGREMGVCYAESRDGIVWKKPELGLVEFDGSTANNLVVRGPHGAGVFRDDHEQDPARRFKMFYSGDPMAVRFSPDGLVWSDQVPCPQVEAAGDTHNNALWVPELDRYIGITRLWDKVRQVGRSESPDFVNWTKAEVVLEGLERHLQTYAMPVFQYAGVYIGLPVIFNTKTDRTHTELAWSPDTIRWRRIDAGTPLIPNGDEGSPDWGCVYGAAYPVFLDDGIRLFYGGSDGPHTSWRNGFLCLATLRPDGFAGFEPVVPGQPAVVTTQPVVCDPNRLVVTADVEGGGSVTVEVLDEGGDMIAAAKPLAVDVTDGGVQWQEDPAANRPPGTAYRFRFTLDAAKLYSFGFR
ncbi:MAG: hypothetical protein GY851_17680 [bacterium]|nr:hypothetical protein [bacterium]